MSTSGNRPEFESVEMADGGRFSPPAIEQTWQAAPTQPPLARKPIGSVGSVTPTTSPNQQSSSWLGNPPAAQQPQQQQLPYQTPTSNPYQSPYQSSDSPPRTHITPQRNQYSPPRHYSEPSRARAAAASTDNPLGIASRPKPTPLQFEQDISSPGPPSSYPTTTSNTPLFAGFRKGLHERGDSQSNLLLQEGGYQSYHAGYQAPSPPDGYGYGGPPPAAPPKYLAWIYRYWLPHYNMYLFLFGGIMFAVGHHLFYKTHDGEPATNQLRVLRYGATLSFISKASLAAATIVAFRQRVWMTVRRKVMSLGAVDSLFAAAEDLSAVFNIELFKQAKLAMLLALYVWSTPLVVILTSETLAVQPKTMSEATMCPSVRTLNFTQEAIKDWKSPTIIDGFPSVSVSFWNISAPLNSSDYFDYWDQTSFQFEKVVTLSTFLKQPIVRDNAALDVCGAGWNCSYTIKFTGPGYKCTELASGAGSKPAKLRNAEVPFDIDILAPKGNFTYVSFSKLGEYSKPQMATGDGGIPEGGTIPDNLGALRTEPIIWIGYAAVDDPSKHQPENRSESGWDDAYTPKIFGCEHYETEYEVDFNYTGTEQKTTIRNRTFIAPIIDTTFQPGLSSSDGTFDNTTADPKSNWILPRNGIEKYRQVAAYHSIGLQMRNFLNGTISKPGNILKTKVEQTKLLDLHSYLGKPDLMGEVQGLYEDILMSFFSDPQLLAVSWAAKPEAMSGTAIGDNSTLYPCFKERTDNRFVYHVQDLWGVYAVAIVLAICGVIVGVLAVWDEGIMRDTRFSSIAAAARGPALEKLPWGPEGATPHTKNFKVGYGLVNRGPVDPGSHGFGLAGEVMQTPDGRRQTFRFRNSIIGGSGGTFYPTAPRA